MEEGQLGLWISPRVYLGKTSPPTWTGIFPFDICVEVFILGPIDKQTELYSYNFKLSKEMLAKTNFVVCTEL